LTMPAEATPLRAAIWYVCALNFLNLKAGYVRCRTDRDNGFLHLLIRTHVYPTVPWQTPQRLSFQQPKQPESPIQNRQRLYNPWGKRSTFLQLQDIRRDLVFLWPQNPKKK